MENKSNNNKPVKKNQSKKKTIKKVSAKKVTELAETKKDTKVKTKVIKDKVNNSETTPKRKTTNDNIIAYKVLSYVFFLWIIGLIVPERDDKSLRFHVGQGMILFIVETVIYTFISLFNEIIVVNMFKINSISFLNNNQLLLMSTIGIVISYVLFLSFFALSIYFMIIGINNAIKGKDEPLPLFGSFTFYK